MKTQGSAVEAVILSYFASQLDGKNSPEARKAVKAWDYFLSLDLDTTPEREAENALNKARTLLQFCSKKYKLKEPVASIFENQNFIMVQIPGWGQ